MIENNSVKQITKNQNGSELNYLLVKNTLNLEG